MRSSLNAKMALAGGVLAGIGASACCVGPLLLLSLGVGGAWIGHLTALEPYRPVFIVLTGSVPWTRFSEAVSRTSELCCGG